VVTVYIIHVPSKEKIFSSYTVAVQGTPSAPTALLSVTAHKVASTLYTLTISHEGGDDLNVADLQVQASSSSGTLQTLPFLNSSGGTTGTFSVGMSTTITCSYSPDVTGQVVTVYIIHNPSHQKIFSSTTIAVQGPTPLSAMLSVTAKDNGDNIVVITISHEGGDDLVISDLKIMASDNNGTMETATKIPSSGTLSVGGTMTAYYNYGADSSDAVITVWVIHVPSSQKLFSSSYIVVQGLPPPNALLSVTAKRNDNTGLTGYTLTISHEGGDDLSVSDLEIMASMDSENMATYAFPGTGTFSVGMKTTITCTYAGNVTSQVVTVYIIHKPSKEKIFASSTVAVLS
jgi:hypothetical protein